MSLQITILVDNPNSWIIPYAEELAQKFSDKKHDVRVVHKHEEVTKGDILIMLSCNRIFRSLELNDYNLVVHESDLPKGRGMSPFTWQIVEGKSEVVVSLLEATEELDAGVIYGKRRIVLKGTELVEEWRALQAEVTQELLLDFVDTYPQIQFVEQTGVPTFYPKRNIEDSKLDIHKSIDEQFNLLRVVDNERYPAWFERNGVAYKIEIHYLNK